MVTLSEPMLSEARWTVANDLSELARVSRLAHALLEPCGLEPETVYATHLALEEVLSNVIRHGYEDGDRHEISVSLRVDDGAVEIRVVDDGREFDPSSAPAVNVEEPLETRKVGGLGVHLLRHMVSDVRYRRAGGRNVLDVRIGRDVC